MTEFIIMEDFPKSEIEFDQRFLDKSACYDYLFNSTKIKWRQIKENTTLNTSQES